MITNERQYKITKSQAEKFAESLRSFDRKSPEFEGVHPKIIDAQFSAIKYQLEDLRQQISQYEEIRSGTFSYNTANTLEDLPMLLIKARIAKGLTQAELGIKLGMKEQQVQRYESQKYGSASLETLKTIAKILEIQITGDASISSDVVTSDIAKRFPIKEMYSRGWFGDFQGNLKQALNNAEELLREFFAKAGLELNGFTPVMHKQNIRTGGKFNGFALHAWHARILIKAEKIEDIGTFKKNDLNAEWLNNLVSLSAEPDGVLKAREYLLESGIRFVIEPHLPETHLDGACLLLRKKYPVIAMTLRHDRIDNFWFVLMHELAHLILHVNQETCLEFFDDLDSEQGGVEEEADKFALDALIPSAHWSKSISRFICTDAAVRKESNIWKIHPAIIAGRIRRETGKYVLFNELIGHGEVRKYFQDDINR